MESKSMQSCGICSAKCLDSIWDLPRLPLTEKYGTFSPSKQLEFDQKLLFCNSCGHVQLESQLAPQLLYAASEYSFRTSQSQSARTGSQAFLDFFLKLKANRVFESVVDVGGNDLYLAKMMPTKNRCVIDPVCLEQDGKVVDGIKIIGKLLEEVDLNQEGLRPDLIFCRHVLEHVAEPLQFIMQLFDQCQSEALYVFEIPCFENLMEANRFDAIFHQHYHYYDLSTFQRLIIEAGGQYLAHCYNRQGSCGGALLIAFQKGTPARKEKKDVAERKAKIVQAIQHYRLQMELMAYQLERLPDPVYGFGASLMLATLGYHLKTNFSKLVCILDDDLTKDGIGYQNFPIQIRHPSKLDITSNANYLITSLENVRPIFKRILELSPRRVLVPVLN